MEIDQRCKTCFSPCICNNLVILVAVAYALILVEYPIHEIILAIGGIIILLLTIMLIEIIGAVRKKEPGQ